MAGRQGDARSTANHCKRKGSGLVRIARAQCSIVHHRPIRRRTGLSQRAVAPHKAIAKARMTAVSQDRSRATDPLESRPGDIASEASWEKSERASATNRLYPHNRRNALARRFAAPLRSCVRSLHRYRRTAGPHITWADDKTMKLESDAGQQSRLFHFDGSKWTAGGAQWQGESVASWQKQAQQRGFAPPYNGAASCARLCSLLRSIWSCVFAASAKSLIQ